MAQNFDLTQTGQELQERVDQVFPNRDEIAALEEAKADRTELLDEIARAQGVEGDLQFQISGNLSAQTAVNDNVAVEIANRYTKSETYNKTELDNMITTPDVQYVTVTATAQTTSVTDVLPATGAANTVYRVGSWDGTQYDANSYAEYSWNGTAYVLMDVKNVGIATGADFDNPTAAQRALLTTVGAVLDGCDAIPTAGSVKPIQSGGVYDTVTDIVGCETNYLSGYTVQKNGHIGSSSESGVSFIIPVAEGDTVEWFVGSVGSSNRRLAFYNSLETTNESTFIAYKDATDDAARTITANTGAVCLRFAFALTEIQKVWLKINGESVYFPQSSKQGVINERLAALDTQLSTRIATEEEKREELSLLYDSTINDSLTKQNGTIYTSGAPTSSSAYYRWFVKNSAFSKITVRGRTAPSFAQVAFYNSETPSAETLIEGQSYAGTNANKIYTLDVPSGCKLIGFSCYTSVYQDYFYYKIYTKNIVFASGLQAQIDANNTNLQNQITNLEVAYDTNSFKSESGTILVNGNKSRSDVYCRWFIENDNFKHINVYARVASSQACLAFYNDITPSAGTLIVSYAGTASKKLYSYDIPDECKLIGIATQLSSLSDDNPAYFNIYLSSIVPITNQINSVESDLKFKIGNNSSIISLNSPLDMGLKLSILSKNKTALTLAHFSDIHDDKANLLRFIEFRDKYNDYITDSICTGDLAWNLYTDSPGHPTFSSFWDEVDGTSNILVTIGNHETAITENTWSGADAVDVYNKFMKRCVENPVNNVVHEGTKNYYYKDYTSQGIRLIVLDPYYDIEAQNTWLQGVLADALSNDLSVICAEHNPFAYIDFIDCSFTAARFAFGGDTINSSWGNKIASFVASVDAFQNNNGKFICWIAGHVHSDIVSVHHNYPNQLMLSASCATHEQSAGNSNIRTEGTKNQDNFNIYSFDTALKVITVIRIGQDTDAYMRHRGSLCISYDTKEVLWND